MQTFEIVNQSRIPSSPPTFAMLGGVLRTALALVRVVKR
jgi:hypothetical protein